MLTIRVNGPLKRSMDQFYGKHTHLCPVCVSLNSQSAMRRGHSDWSRWRSRGLTPAGVSRVELRNLKSTQIPVMVRFYISVRQKQSVTIDTMLNFDGHLDMGTGTVRVHRQRHCFSYSLQMGSIQSYGVVYT